jgi:hypothetical protein
MAEETKITLKMGLIASGVAALVVMMVAAMWNYHGRITVLETNYTHVSSTLTDIKETLKDIRADQIRREKQERR